MMKTWKSLLLTFMLAAVPASSVSARMSEDPIGGGGYDGGSTGGGTSPSSSIQQFLL